MDRPGVGIFEVVIVGGAESGRHSILNALSGGKPDSESPTIIHPLGKLVVSTWNATKQRKAISTHTRKADIIIFVYDVTREDSLAELGEVILDVLRNGTTPWVCLMLIGNKCDLTEEKNELRKV